jgi:hypothetical protein
MGLVSYSPFRISRCRPCLGGRRSSANSIPRPKGPGPRDRRIGRCISSAHLGEFDRDGVRNGAHGSANNTTFRTPTPRPQTLSHQPRSESGGLARDGMRRSRLLSTVRESLRDNQIRPFSNWGSSGRRFKSCQPGQSFSQVTAISLGTSVRTRHRGSRDPGCPMNVAVAKSCEHLDGLDHRSMPPRRRC